MIERDQDSGPEPIQPTLHRVLEKLAQQAGPKQAAKLRDLLNELKYGRKGGAA